MVNMGRDRYLRSKDERGFKERRTNMEVKNGEKTISIPGWVIAAGIATVGTIVADICKTIGMKRK